MMITYNNIPVKFFLGNREVFPHTSLLLYISHLPYTCIYSPKLNIYKCNLTNLKLYCKYKIDKDRKLELLEIILTYKINLTNLNQ